MAIATYATFQSNLVTKGVKFEGFYAGPSSTNLLQRANILSSWGVYATPSTAVVPTSATLGSLPIPQGSGGTGYRIYQMMLSQGSGDNVWWLCDRLSHQGGIVGNLNTAQTTNLPTAALTRCTTGAGVFAALEIYSSIGGTGTTVAMNYTNSAGTPGQVGRPAIIGGTGNQSPPRFIALPMANGDKGVRSVESITLTATTGTAGSMGVVLFKPIALFFSDFSTTAVGRMASQNMVLSGGMQLEKIEPLASLFFLHAGSVAGNIYFELTLAED